MRMSGSGQAANSLAWPSAVPTSAATAMTLALVALRISSAVFSSRLGSSPLIDHLAAGFGEPERAGAAQPPARGADDGLAAGDTEIHCDVSC